MDGWNTSLSFSDGLFSGAMLVLGSVRCSERSNGCSSGEDVVSLITEV